MKQLNPLLAPLVLILASVAATPSFAIRGGNDDGGFAAEKSAERDRSSVERPTRERGDRNVERPGRENRGGGDGVGVHWTRTYEKDTKTWTDVVTTKDGTRTYNNNKEVYRSGSDHHREQVEQSIRNGGGIVAREAREVPTRNEASERQKEVERVAAEERRAARQNMHSPF